MIDSYCFLKNNNGSQLTWPHAAAVAERAWSAPNVTLPIGGGTDEGFAVDPSGNGVEHAFTSKVTVRLANHRCRMLRRGVAAAPVNGAGASFFGEDNPTMSAWGHGLCPHDRGGAKPQ